MVETLQNIKDPLSFLTHFIGFLLSIFGLIILLMLSDGIHQWVAFSVFGVTMMLMYGSSSVYHFYNLSERGTNILRKIDHSMIYVFIAGSFTPFILLLMEGWFKWVMISVVWVIGFSGIVLKIVWLHAPRWLSTTFYLGMGWLGVVIIPFIFMEVPYAAWWVVAGGLSYSVGAIVYVFKKPNPIPEWFGFHEIWHLFVMGGSLCHYWSVYRYLAV